MLYIGCTRFSCCANESLVGAANPLQNRVGVSGGQRSSMDRCHVWGVGNDLGPLLVPSHPLAGKFDRRWRWML